MYDVFYYHVNVSSGVCSVQLQFCFGIAASAVYYLFFSEIHFKSTPMNVKYIKINKNTGPYRRNVHGGGFYIELVIDDEVGGA